MSENEILTRSPAQEISVDKNMERTTSINGTEFYYYSTEDYNFVAQKSPQGYMDFAIYYADENIIKSGDFFIEDARYQNNTININSGCRHLKNACNWLILLSWKGF